MDTNKYQLSMKKILLIVVVLMSGLLCQAQHTIYLRNGEKLKGRVDGGRKDSIYFKFMDNRMRFATNDILAIYFDENLAPDKIVDPDAAEKTSHLLGFAIDSNVRTNKMTPDANAKIWIVDSTAIPYFDMPVIDAYLMGSASREVAAQFKANKKKVPEDVKQTMKMYHAEDDDEFEELCSKTNKNLSMLKGNKATLKSTSDSRGHFNIAMKGGVYYILVESGSYKGNTSVETDGKIFCQKVIVPFNDDVPIKAIIDVL